MMMHKMNNNNTELLTILRLSQIIGDKKTEPPTIPIIPISRQTWLKGIEAGIYPKPLKISPGLRG
jgi:prophage regulatory protein